MDSFSPSFFLSILFCSDVTFSFVYTMVSESDFVFYMDDDVDDDDDGAGRWEEERATEKMPRYKMHTHTSIQAQCQGNEEPGGKSQQCF